MQAQLDELDKKVEKPTSESSNILSSIDLSSIVEPAQDRKEPDYLAYKKFYAQLLEFFEDISKYKYEKDFTQEVDEICNKNIRHLV